MSFLAPLLLVGLAGLLVPVAIHLIGRRRARVVRFAALDFLIATKRRTARRFQLRERLLLVVRVLLCVALPLALAKPFTSCESKGPLIARGHLSLDYYADFYRGATILCWRKLQPYVEEQRANGFSNLFEWFQWLAERLEARSPSLNASAHVQFAEWKSPADFQRLRFRSKEP